VDCRFYHLPRIVVGFVILENANLELAPGIVELCNSEDDPEDGQGYHENLHPWHIEPQIARCRADLEIRLVIPLCCADVTEGKGLVLEKETIVPKVGDVRRDHHTLLDCRRDHEQNSKTFSVLGRVWIELEEQEGRVHGDGSAKMDDHARGEEAQEGWRVLVFDRVAKKPDSHKGGAVVHKVAPEV